MNTNNFNPFEGIMAEMNALKGNYETGMRELQQRLNMARQAANSMFQNPMNPNMQQQPAAAPAPTEVPQQVQHLTVLGEIKSGIEKTNELLNQFLTGVPLDKKEVEPLKQENNESGKK